MVINCLFSTVVWMFVNILFQQSRVVHGWNLLPAKPNDLANLNTFKSFFYKYGFIRVFRVFLIFYVSTVL